MPVKKMTKDRGKEQRQELLKEAQAKAVKAGRLWKLQHMNATDNDAIETGATYSEASGVDEPLGDAMMEGFMWGTEKVESVPSLGWHVKDLLFLIHLKEWTYRRSKGDLIIQTDQDPRTYSDDYYGIQAATQDMLNEFEEDEGE